MTAPRHILADIVDQISEYVGEHSDEPEYTPVWAADLGAILDTLRVWEDPK